MPQSWKAPQAPGLCASCHFLGKWHRLRDCVSLSPSVVSTEREATPGPPPSLASFFQTMLSKLSFHLTAKSGNAKTGPMAVSTSAKSTCSPSCPFLDNGCYATSGPLNLHWLKVSSGERGSNFATFLESLQQLPEGSAFRHNQAGDLPHNAGKISETFIRKMVKAVSHLRAYTYTHHSLKIGDNLSLIRKANRAGFTINVSCESERQVDETIEAGLPAVVVVDADESRNQWRTPDGNVVLVCPAQRSDTKTCVDCMLCHKRGKRVAIAFKAHGNSKRKVSQTVAALA